MPASDIVDNSPTHPSPAKPIETASNLVLIDNYDSFTWNVYQYLVLEGASVTVIRNDETTLDGLINREPTQLVISPGPGHPDTDTGMSNEAIRHFSGKIPILGVCIGEQCVYSVFGGQVEETGQILHGKTSLLRHDSKGVYKDIPQNIPVTRYHSLAGTHPTLPDCLEVSSWTSKGPDSQKDVIMGVRHKEYLIEGVQFHPESILTAEGRSMLKNFLGMQGGTWTEYERLSKARCGANHVTNSVNGNSKGGTRNPSTPQHDPKSGSILDRIFDHRKKVVATQKEIPSQRPSDLQASYDLNLAPSQISFPDRLKLSPYALSLLAEVKRASPSKGIISLDSCAPAQARTYALAGASVISVLTEPHWFKGSIDDLRAVRQSLEGMHNRPAVLRKEFIFDEYQILEASLAGADTVLLIVKMLDESRLQQLYEYSRSLGMEPLVEVNTVEEMDVASRLNAQVIGVNNRNLATFDVDLDTTSRLMNAAPSDSVVCALSGISGAKDVEPYQKNGVGAVLVGEALMRASNVSQFVAELLGGTADPKEQTNNPDLLVKICGTRSSEAAGVAIEAGADLIGMILVEGRRRCVSKETALAISEKVHGTVKPTSASANSRNPERFAVDFFSVTSSWHVMARDRALLVGVFQNQPLEHILEQVHALRLDVVQLHGDEPLEWASAVPVPVIKSFKAGDANVKKRGYHAMGLVDAGSGGSGESVNYADTDHTLQSDPELKIFMAGGLNSENVAEVLFNLGQTRVQVCGVDVSSGVEEKGEQSMSKIRDFVKSAKNRAYLTQR
ncbi:MAG: bifunctional tryptophan synthase trp1 [Alyxoria varia]|nr:MAG: bifunctional tryptophan synthase trp1 [Alyxoria varia]